MFNLNTVKYYKQKTLEENFKNSGKILIILHRRVNLEKLQKIKFDATI